MTENPAAALRLDKEKGRLLNGYDADAVLLTEDLRVAATVAHGHIIWRA